ncbi:PfkB family carbohydrate kinase [Thermodesulfovibrio yellowstonii]|uniref:PfkB family carbohydrate kinase n=1 Tax=Thermodesulfovibrio yellowstonii TaxID=28262 RepID=UPI003C7CC24A
MLKGVCIGAAHVDIFADVNENEIIGAHIDKRGSFYISIGGTACNVGVGLTQLGAIVHLITALPKGRLFSELVKFYLRKVKNLNPVYEYIETNTDSGFIAIRQNKDLVFAVNSCPLESFVFPINRYKRLLNEADFIMIDLNCLLETLKEVIGLIKNPEDRLYISAVSEIKSLKLLGIAPFKAKAVFMNHEEYNFLTMKANAVLSSLSSCLWFVTYPDGVKVLTGNGAEVIEIKHNPIIPKGAYSGCGDAFTAGCIYFLASGETSIEVACRSAFAMVDFAMERPSAQVVDDTIINGVDIIYRDALTGLYQRKYLEEHRSFLNSCVRRYYTVMSVLMIDIDHFKKVNDTYGHIIGDKVLKVLGSIIQCNLRATDIAARYGGEEICVVLINTPADKAKIVADYILELVRETRIPVEDGKSISVTVSIGVAEGTDIDTVISDADKALYEAKNTGRNKVVIYDEQMALKDLKDLKDKIVRGSYELQFSD